MSVKTRITASQSFSASEGDTPIEAITLATAAFKAALEHLAAQRPVGLKVDWNSLQVSSDTDYLRTFNDIEEKPVMVTLNLEVEASP